VHEQIVRFKLAIDKDNESLQPKSAEIIKSEFTLIPSSSSLTQFNDKYLSRNKDALRTLSGLRVQKLLSPDSSSSSEKDIAALIKLPSITFEEAQEVLKTLSSWKSSEVDSFRQAAATKWPKATVFT
jgi:peptide alpha-N-acetyltransferase